MGTTRVEGHDGVTRRPPAAARASVRAAAVSGVLAAGLTLAVAHALAALVAPTATPLVAVGNAFIDGTPAWLKDAAIAVFGVHDKTALLVGMVVVLAAVAAGVGIVARRHPRSATVLVMGLGGVGAVAAATRTDAAPLAVVPSLGGAVAGAIALRVLVDRTWEGAAPGVLAGPVPPASGLGRRSFLTAAASVAALAVLAGAAGTVVGAAGRVTAAARDRIRLPRPARPAPPIPAGARAPVEGVVDLVTPNDQFFRIDTALTVPQVDPDGWSLRVHGLVEREVSLSLAELLEADLVETYVTLACVSNPVGGDLIGNARWLGLPVRDLLTRAGPLPGADMVLSTSVDGFTASTPLAALTDGRDALLAVGMNGAPLPVDHGFPVRMIVPGLYGYVSATKWVVGLEVTRFADREAYWTERGWSERGPIKTSSRIEVPRLGARVSPGLVAVGGTAWAQHTGIVGVEVQVDDGPWQAADLSAEISIDTWRQWSWSWPATPGRHTLRVRAIDAAGLVQTDRVAPVVPDGATGRHEIDVLVEDA